MAEWLPWINGAVLLALAGAVIKLAFAVGGKNRQIEDQSGSIEQMEAEIDNLQRDNVKLRADVLERLETMRHETGEMGNALRTKIHDVETWNRDTFVRKDSFEMVIGRLEKSIEKLGDKIEDRLDRIASNFKPKT